MATSKDSSKSRKETKEAAGDEEESVSNAFANDGSFLEQFRKKMAEAKKPEEKREKGTDGKEGAPPEDTKRKEEAAQAEASNFVSSFMGGLKGKRKSLMKTKPPPSKKKKSKNEEVVMGDFCLWAGLSGGAWLLFPGRRRWVCLHRSLFVDGS
eukprot:m.25073 g.25073  ORF g.25073 m.25073 type:complete len:153 (+) comp28729_c0_seq3:23-481(+)